MPERYADPLPAVTHAGVTHEAWPRLDHYVGSADAIVAAGLVPRDRLPGAPGMNQVAVRLFPDGSMPLGSKYIAQVRTERGAKWVYRKGNRVMVMVWLGGDRRGPQPPDAYHLEHHRMEPLAPMGPGTGAPRLRVLAGGGQSLPGPRRPAVLRVVRAEAAR